MNDNVVPIRRKKNASNVFAIDRRAWHYVCRFGLNCAVAYLVLANGTGGDNRTTKWSAKATRDYGGLGRGRDKIAIQTLEQYGIVKLLKGGTMPRRYLQPAHEIPGCEGYPPAPLTPKERQVLDKCTPRYRPTPNELSAKNALINKRHARWIPDAQALEAIPYDAETATKPDWIWLPRTLVEGAGDEFPPIAMLHQAQDIALLRLFIDLYHAHTLWQESGIDPRALEAAYERKRIGSRETLTVWSFEATGKTVHGRPSFVAPFLDGEGAEIPEGKDRPKGWNDFFAALGKLERFGLVEAVPHVFTSDKPEGEVMHALPLKLEGGLALPCEAELAMAADRAARAILPQMMTEKRDAVLVPVQTHIEHATVRGIYRLRYRPQTQATAQWLARVTEECGTWTRRYYGLHDRAAAGQSLSLAVQHQG